MSTRNRRSNKEKRARRRRNRRIALGVFILVMILTGYGSGCSYFEKHFFPGTKINGVDCGLATEKKAFDMITDQLLTYEMIVKSEDGDLPVKAHEVGLAYEDSTDLKGILQRQDRQKWFVHLSQSSEHTAMKSTLNDEMLTKTVESLACMNPAKPRASEDAKITFNEEKGEFVAQDGPKGNQIDKEPFIQAVKESMLAGAKELDLSTEEYYLPAKNNATSKTVEEAKKNANKYVKMKIHYKLGDKTLDISKKSLASFVKISDDFKVSINEDAVKKYVKKSISKKFDTAESLQVIDTPGSGKIYVTKGDEGTKAVNVGEEKKKLLADLKNGKDVSREPVLVKDYFYTNYADVIKEDYIDINLANQMVYVVLGGKIAVQTPCVTGNISNGHGSPTGIYRIAYKTRNYTMVKYNAFVRYWMPYDTRYGIGLHDASWRSQFGGQIYRTDGSHGCINLPTDAAAKIYEVVYKGLPVMVHW